MKIIRVFHIIDNCIRYTCLVIYCVFVLPVKLCNRVTVRRGCWDGGLIVTVIHNLLPNELGKWTQNLALERNPSQTWYTVGDGQTQKNSAWVLTVCNLEWDKTGGALDSGALVAWESWGLSKLGVIAPACLLSHTLTTQSGVTWLSVHEQS